MFTYFRTICDSLIVNHRVSKEMRGQNSCCCPSSDEGISSSASSNASYASNCDHECVEIVVPEFDFLIGSRLFELYLALQKFYAIGKDFSLPTSGTNSTYLLVWKVKILGLSEQTHKIFKK
jgi:hypothetical protein